MSKFYIDSGEIKKCSDAVFTADYTFGLHDMIHETIRLSQTKALFLAEHIQNCMDTMDVLAFPYPKSFSVQEIQRHITRLLNVNKVYKGGICKLVIYRKAHVFNGLESTQSSYALFIESCADVGFQFNMKGVRMALLPSVQIQTPYLYSMYSAHMIVQHKIHKIFQNTGVNAVAFFTQESYIFHSSYGDIFYVSQDQVYCPEIEINTFRHPLTDFIIQHMRSNKIVVHEESQITVEHILQADEVFVVHPLYGVQWVVSCNNTTYGFSLSKKISDMLQGLV